MKNAMVATLVLSTMMLLGSGCHPAPCGGCAQYETCDVAADACVLNLGTRFDLIAVSGDVPGSDWDPFFGPPDPFICAAADGPESCTEPQSDDSSPKWNTTLISDLDGDTLTGSRIAIRYEDSDLDSPDIICQGGVTVTAELIHAGGFTFTCNNGARAQFDLQNTDRGTPAVVLAQ